MFSNQEIVEKIRNVIQNKDIILESLTNEELKRSFQNLIDQLEKAILYMDQNKSLSDDLINLFNNLNIK